MNKCLIILVSFLLIANIMPLQGEGRVVSSEIVKFESKLKSAEKLKNWKNAAVYSEKLAGIYEGQGNFSKAVHYYRRAATHWEKTGHSEWGISDLIRAEEIDTQLKLFVEQRNETEENLEIIESASGILLALFILKVNGLYGPLVDEAFKRMITEDFLLDVKTAAEEIKPSVYVPIEEITKLRDKRNCVVYVKLPLGEQPYYVATYQGHRKLAESYSSPWEINIDFANVNAKQPITIIAFDKDFQRLAQQDVHPFIRK